MTLSWARECLPEGTIHFSFTKEHLHFKKTTQPHPGFKEPKSFCFYANAVPILLDFLLQCIHARAVLSHKDIIHVHDSAHFCAHETETRFLLAIPVVRLGRGLTGELVKRPGTSSKSAVIQKRLSLSLALLFGLCQATVQLFPSLVPLVLYL